MLNTRWLILAFAVLFPPTASWAQPAPVSLRSVTTGDCSPVAVGGARVEINVNCVINDLSKVLARLDQQDLSLTLVRNPEIGAALRKRQLNAAIDQLARKPNKPLVELKMLALLQELNLDLAGLMQTQAELFRHPERQFENGLITFMATGASPAGSSRNSEDGRPGAPAGLSEPQKFIWDAMVSLSDRPSSDLDAFARDAKRLVVRAERLHTKTQATLNLQMTLTAMVFVLEDGTNEAELASRLSVPAAQLEELFGPRAVLETMVALMPMLLSFEDAPPRSIFRIGDDAARRLEGGNTAAQIPELAVLDEIVLQSYRSFRAAIFIDNYSQPEMTEFARHIVAPRERAPLPAHAMVLIAGGLAAYKYFEDEEDRPADLVALRNYLRSSWRTYRSNPLLRNLMIQGFCEVEIDVSGLTCPEDDDDD